MKEVRSLAVALACLLFSSAVGAELKLAYIDSEVLRQELPEFKSVERQVQRLMQQFEQEATERQSKLLRLQEDFRKQELLMSEARKAEMQVQFEESQRQLQEFTQQKFGPNGELFRKNVELSSPILERINAAIESIAKEDGYDFIFDVANGGVIVYVDPDGYNLTTKLLEFLKKEREEQEKGRQ